MVGVKILFTLNDLNIGSRILHFEKQGSTAISVSENDDYRWMSIDGAVQSVLFKPQPQHPVLPHLSAVLMALRYYLSAEHIAKNTSDDLNVLELGLGAGSLPRFFSHHFSTSKITSIENNPAVVSLFQKWFSQPHNTSQAQHKIVLADASQKITEYQHQDLLFVDLFAKKGSPDFVSTLPFYQNCMSALNDNGILTINLIAQYQLQLEMTLELLQQLKLHIRTFSIPGYQNKVIIAARQPLPFLQYDDSLVQFARKYDLDLNQIVAMN